MTTSYSLHKKQITSFNLGLALMFLALLSGCGVEKLSAPVRQGAGHETVLSDAKRFTVGAYQSFGTTPPMTYATPAQSFAQEPQDGTVGPDCTIEQKAYDEARLAMVEAENLWRAMQTRMTTLALSIEGQKKELEGYNDEIKKIVIKLLTAEGQEKKLLEARLEELTSAVEIVTEALERNEYRLAVGTKQLIGLEEDYDAKVLMQEEALLDLKKCLVKLLPD